MLKGSELRHRVTDSAMSALPKWHFSMCGVAVSSMNPARVFAGNDDHDGDDDGFVLFLSYSQFLINRKK